ncbi:hypothetical protein GGF37_005426, partial [Kickxella alabastrina]
RRVQLILTTMDYKEFYKSLWDQMSQTKSGESEDYGQILGMLSGFEAAINRSTAAGALIPRDQWLTSLCVAASFTATGFAWSAPSVARQANAWIAAIAAQLRITDSTGSVKVSAELFRSICTISVLPYFSAKAESAQDTYVLMGDDNRKDVGRGSDDHKWRDHPQCIATFQWALEHLVDSDVTTVISIILPVILALVDDYSIMAKIRGLRLAILLMEKVGAEFLRKTGIAGILEKSIDGCLVFRSDEGQLGIDLLSAGFKAAIQVGRIQYARSDDMRYTARWWALTEKVISNDLYVSDNVAAIEVLCRQIAPLCKALGPAIARYLRPLVGVLTKGLHSPVYLSSNLCRLHVVVLEQLQALIEVCPQRIHAYCKDVVAAMGYSWVGMQKGSGAGVGGGGFKELRGKIIAVLNSLRSACPEETRQATMQLAKSRPAAFADWEKYFH